MKVSQIVSEHKKGVRAMKYGKKTKSTVPVYGPEAKDAKLKPVKPAGPVSEAVLKAFEPGKQAVISDPEKGTDITLDLTKPQNMAALKPNDNGQLEYDPTPDMAAQGAQQQANPLKPGAEITIKADEGGDIGGDPTDQFIKDVTDAEFEKAQGREVDEALDTVYPVQLGPQPMAKTSPKPTAIVASKKWTAITPEIEEKAGQQGFRKVLLQFGGKTVPGLEGGDQQLGSKIIVAPSDFESMTSTGASTMRRGMGVQSAERTGIGAPALREADDILLDKMLTIAGLR
jgi:hypothetical protein